MFTSKLTLKLILKLILKFLNYFIIYISIRHYREREIVSWEQDDEIMNYYDTWSFYFSPDDSEGKESDEITIVNPVVFVSQFEFIIIFYLNLL